MKDLKQGNRSSNICLWNVNDASSHLYLVLVLILLTNTYYYCGTAIPFRSLAIFGFFLTCMSAFYSFKKVINSQCLSIAACGVDMVNTGCRLQSPISQVAF